jgi:hypothetical protein
MDRASMGNEIKQSPARKKGSKGFGNRYQKNGYPKLNPRIQMTKRIQGARER